MTKIPRLRFKGFEYEWEEEYLKDISEIKNGVTGDTNLHDSDFKITRIETISNGVIDEDKLGYIDGNPGKDKLLKFGDILYSNINSIDHIGKTAIFHSTSKIYHGINLTRIIINNFNDPFFINYLLNTDNYRVWSKRHANQAVSQASINNKDLGKMDLFLPRKEEQNKISSFFIKLDKIIDFQTKKLEQLWKLKQGYLQKMFPQDGESVPRLRFSGFSGDWKEEKLGRLLIHNTIRNKDGNITNVESVSNKFGFIKQTDQFDDYSVASKDLSNYFVISPGMFAYNPSRINVGSIAYKYESQSISIVSPLYVSFKTNELIDDDFFLDWFKTEYFRQQREKYSEGGVRDTLSYKSLSEFKFMLPSLEEQKQIGSFISKLDQMINNQSDKISALQQEKKSYLQKMFI